MRIVVEFHKWSCAVSESVHIMHRSVSAKRFDDPFHTDDEVDVANINDVAEAAGVSISTVSYALSGKRPVAPDTRRRIEEVIHELGYSPNAGARMLAGSRTQIFALTEPLRKDTHAPTHMAFVLATAIAARRNDYDILLLTDEQAQAGMSRVAANGLVDAILVLDVAPDDPRVAPRPSDRDADGVHRRSRTTTTG